MESKKFNLLAGAALLSAALFSFGCQPPDADKPGVPADQRPKPEKIRVRCPLCKGDRSVIGANGIRQECWNCDGRGIVEIDPKLR